MSLGEPLNSDSGVASHPLTGGGFSGSSIVAFKIDVKTTSNWHDSGIDNLAVTGTVAVPEPSLYAVALGLLAIGLILVRRRQKS